ncbi:hypothetical protein [Actinokineospora pegani]|uniref:hypothetical protein n=1 Tax=Actinokineospora pegani TaxID=2654637 RepID=UPI0012EAAD35|nr:hypothetical protein [Actinokineospora pegani]
MTDTDTREVAQASRVVFAQSAHVLLPAGEDVSMLPADTWPVFAFAVSDADLGASPAGRVLLEVLRARQPVRLLDTPATWTVLAQDPPLLCLRLSATAPTPFALSIAVAASPFADRLDALAEGATVAVTTPGRARELTPGIGRADALHALVLARAERSTAVESLACRA